MQIVVLPSLWPRMGRVSVKEGESEVDTHGEEEVRDGNDGRIPGRLQRNEEGKGEGLRWRGGSANLAGTSVDDGDGLAIPERMLGII